MATSMPDAQQLPDNPVMGQQVKLASLMQNGGLIVIGETIVTLHEEGPDAQCWITIGYGIPCLAAGEDQLIVSVTGVDDGETLHEFRLSSRDDYKELDKHFHVLTAFGADIGEERTYGMTFAHEKVAERFFAAVKQLAPGEVTQLPPRFSERSTKMVSVEATDLPSLHGRVLRDEEEAGALTASGRITMREFEESVGGDDRAVRLQQIATPGEGSEPEHRDEIVEEVDEGRHQLMTSKQLKDTSRDRVDISHPTSCKHVAHVGVDTPVHALAQVINTGEDLSTVHVCKSERRSFPPAPPPMTNFEKLLKELQAQSFRVQRSPTTQSADGGGTDKTEETDSASLSSETSCGESFHMAVAQLIRKKLHDEALYSKLVSFTASGREEKCEKPLRRAASVIIHDHGIVCL